jgi:hypothetical protein
MHTLAFFTDWLWVTRPNFTSPDMSMNKIADTGAIALFSGSVILRFGDIAWSASSPNLSVHCHFLWRQLTAKVRMNKPCTLEALREHIRDGIRAIDAGLFHAVMVKL